MAGWMSGEKWAFSHPLPLFHMDSRNAPYVSHATSFHSQLLSTFAFLPPSLISTLIKMLHKKMTPYHYSALPGYPLPQNKQKMTPFSFTSKLSHLHSGPTPKCTPVHDRSASETQV